MNEDRNDQRDDESRARDDLGHAPNPPDRAQPLGYGRNARREREALAPRVVGSAQRRHQREHDEEEDELHQARRVGEVERQHL